MIKYIYNSKIHSNQSELNNGREKVGIESLKNSKTFIDYSQKIHDVFESLADYNQIWNQIKS